MRTNISVMLNYFIGFLVVLGLVLLGFEYGGEVYNGVVNWFKDYITWRVVLEFVVIVADIIVVGLIVFGFGSSLIEEASGVLRSENKKNLTAQDIYVTYLRENGLQELEPVMLRIFKEDSSVFMKYLRDILVSQIRPYMHDRDRVKSVLDRKLGIFFTYNGVIETLKEIGEVSNDDLELYGRLNYLKNLPEEAIFVDRTHYIEWTNKIDFLKGISIQEVPMFGTLKEAN